MKLAQVLGSSGDHRMQSCIWRIGIQLKLRKSRRILPKAGLSNWAIGRPKFVSSFTSSVYQSLHAMKTFVSSQNKKASLKGEDYKPFSSTRGSVTPFSVDRSNPETFTRLLRTYRVQHSSRRATMTARKESPAETKYMGAVSAISRETTCHPRITPDRPYV